MHSVSLHCLHPLEEVPQFVFRGVSTDVPLYLFNHLFTKFMLRIKTHTHTKSYTNVDKKEKLRWESVTLGSYVRVEWKVDFGENFFIVHVSVEDLNTLGLFLTENPSLL